MPTIPNKIFFETTRASLNRTITYHRSALNKLKKPRKKVDIGKMINHRKELEKCEEAREIVVQWLHHWRENPKANYGIIMLGGSTPQS